MPLLRCGIVRLLTCLGHSNVSRIVSLYMQFIGGKLLPEDRSLLGWNWFSIVLKGTGAV